MRIEEDKMNYKGNNLRIEDNKINFKENSFEMGKTSKQIEKKLKKQLVNEENSINKSNIYNYNN